MKSDSLFLILAALLGLLAVVLGAFGAHGLATILTTKQLAIYQTAVDYQFYHVLALFLTAIILKISTVYNHILVVAGWFFVVGILLFSGSLYLLAVTNISQLGIITPLGGVSFILGWGALLYYGIRS